MPRIEQLVLLQPLGETLDEAEARAFRARKRAEAAGGAYIASLSFRTVTYKALCAADQLAAFYADLRDPELSVPFGIFHQRFSTNTSPTWERAQPFRLLCHNGEINSIDGNVAWMRARGHVLEEDGSDSTLLDNALELLVRDGRDVRHAAAMLIPEAIDADPELDGSVRNFYRYHSTLLEPWDGPAGVVFTDGRVVGANLDRNGLRPLRYAVADGRFVACASEAGALPLPEGARIRRGRLGPGEMLVVDPAVGIEENTAVKQRAVPPAPVHALAARGGEDQLRPARPVEPPAESLTPRQAAAGYTREDLTLLLRPSAATGHEPTSSMGDDTALPPLAGRARPLTSYLRQRFAQVTNPPIDHLRERSVMSLQDVPRGSRAAHRRTSARSPLARARELLPLSLGRSHELARARSVSRRPSCRASERHAVSSPTKRPRRRETSSSSTYRRYRQCSRSGRYTSASSPRAAARRRPSSSSSDEPREAHDFACLLGYGADAICPRLALETVAALAADDKLGGDHPSPAEAQLRFRESIEDGVLKIMSKMGIAEVALVPGRAALRGNRARTRRRRALPARHAFQDRRRRLRRARARAARARPMQRSSRIRATSSSARAASRTRRARPSSTRCSKPHTHFAAATTTASPRSSTSARRSSFATCSSSRTPAARSHSTRSSRRERSCAASRAERCRTDRSRPRRTRRSRPRSTGSHARSNSGEGGEDPARFRTERNSRIKQVASARFGVTPGVPRVRRRAADQDRAGLEARRGGQLPGHKVTAEIARLRHTQPGVELISPPPHHDIYSIEDLAQLVFDLRQANPAASVSVKLVASDGRRTRRRGRRQGARRRRPHRRR